MVMRVCEDSGKPKAVLAGAFNLLLGANSEAVWAEQNYPKHSRTGWPPVFSFCPSSELAKQLKREGYDRFRYFLALPSRRTTRWLLPFEHNSGMLAGTEIYLPHRWAPRALKSVLVRLTNLGCTGWLRPGVLLASRGAVWLESLVQEVTGEPRPIFAFSFGRQAAVRKLTIQVMRGSAGRGDNGDASAPEILGYMKIPLNEQAEQRVRHEASTLEHLWQFCSVKKHIPCVLFAGDWNATFVLFQSALRGELGPTQLNGIHTQFLETLGSVQRIERPGKTLITKVAKNWEMVETALDDGWRQLAREVLARTTGMIGNIMLPLAMTHGDFTPWNTRVSPERELLLFDWESADWEAPATWDIAHFEVLTASACLRKIKQYQITKESWGKPSFLLYLLNSVRQFVQEGNHEAVQFRRELLIHHLQAN